MVEILVLISLTNHIGKIVETKGHKSGKYKWMTVGLWFGGEIVGAIIGSILAGGDESATCLLYIIALLGAAAGAAIANSIANKLEPLPGYPKLPESANQTNSAQKLQDQKEMLDVGLVTSEEYETKKAEAPSKMAQEIAPNPPKIKTIYSFIAHDQDAPISNDMAQAIYSYAYQNVRQKEPELNQLFIQADKEKTPYVLGTGIAKDENGCVEAFEKWLKTKGINIKDVNRKKKTSIFQGSVQDPQTGKSINWISLIYFDLGDSNVLDAPTQATQEKESDVREAVMKAEQQTRMEMHQEQIKAKVPQEIAPNQQATTNVRKKNNLSMFSMILGVVSIPLSFCGVGILFAIAAVIMGFVARKQIKDSRGMQEGNGMALAGIITGGFVIILFICVLIIAILMLMGPIIGNVFSTINSSLSVP